MRLFSVSLISIIIYSVTVITRHLAVAKEGRLYTGVGKPANDFRVM